jgi:hAT family C-terminal dimerisation region
MAFDLLAIPAMSAECERVFSEAKPTLGPQRNKMIEATLNAMQCLKN